jgi:hypothetical protein
MYYTNEDRLDTTQAEPNFDSYMPCSDERMWLELIRQLAELTYEKSSVHHQRIQATLHN